MLFLEKGELQQESYGCMVEEIFDLVLESFEGDYILQVQVLAGMKPTGW